jgi:hypothetical protein
VKFSLAAPGNLRGVSSVEDTGATHYETANIHLSNLLTPHITVQYF